MDLTTARREANYSRYVPGRETGFYESYFLRANHPDRPLAFWIRYTLFSPRGRQKETVGELWGVWFDGETGRHAAVKKIVPITSCTFESSQFSVRIGDASLGPDSLQGRAASGGHHMTWRMDYRGREEPLFLLPLPRYVGNFPKAKSLVGLPLAAFNGFLAVDDKRFEITDWVGSQNHNWGVKHTDDYAWGQVAGFDTHPETFLEAASACLRFGPLRTPYVTPVVLRHRGEEFAFNTFFKLCDSRGSFSHFVWVFRAHTRGVRVDGTISAPKESFVGLAYNNPPGGVKHCLNTKIAACEVRFEDRRGKVRKHEILFTKNRAAFEILTDGKDHGVPIVA
ncbi:MAG: hypothetical protein PHN75_06020 [Syntrophales bacterium]|nr:hypothetical protein [Syntrophales bacterium]